MGVLRQAGSDRWVDLLPRTLVGRSPACDLTLDDPSVSGEHAVLAWREGRWELRDLGSRNGSRVDGRATGPGETAVLSEGCQVIFGLGDAVWTLAVGGAPAPRAIQLETGQVVTADGDLLALPDPDNPSAILVREPGGRWVQEHDDGPRPVSDRQHIEVQDHTWELRLGAGVASTVVAPASLDACTIEFAVSSDEEHASWSVRTQTRTIDLGDRVHTYLLLTLARARLADAASGVDDADQGWLYADELARRLDITPEVLKVYVYRARRQLQAAGVAGAPGLVERRASSNQIRFGTDRVSAQRSG